MLAPRMRYSERSTIDLSPNRLSTELRELRDEGARILDLTLSNPTQAGLPSAAVALPSAPSYEPEPLGLLSARNAIAQWMTAQGTPIDAERIVLTASTSEAYAYVFKLLCDAGDDVLAPRPSYPLLAHLARLEGVVLREYPVAFDGRFHVDTAALAASTGERTRAVIAVHPNNPTGSYLDASELRALSALELPLISDEVFAPYRLDADAGTPRSALQLERGLVMSLHGLSKLGLPQLKLSWICVGGEPARAEEALSRLELIADTFLSVATPVQLALPALLEAQAPVVQAIRVRTRENLEALRAACAGSAVSPLHVGGGWTAVLRMPATQSDEAWALDFLRVQHVLVQPGYFYDFEGPPHIVVSLLPEPALFQAGIAKLLEHVASAL
jgi:aspartate/methionine/tyrosine aminotransferase